MMRYLLIVLFAFIACTKEIAPKTGLTGKWEHIETYSDIGNGTGTWSPVSAANRTVISFNANNTFDGGAHTRLAPFKRYEVAGPTTIKLATAAGDSSILDYSLETELVISYTCREACRDRFRRIN